MNWDQSRALLERARQSLAGGVSSPFRAKAPMPLYFSGGCGPRLRDVDGNEYLDYQLAWGPMILGYSHPKVVEALRQAVEGPFAYGGQHQKEIAVAERIQRLVPCAERVAFTSSGSEALQLAHRLVRAYTRRGLILKFEGHYHGWMDSALMSYHPAAHEVGPLEAPHTVLHSAGQVRNAAENVVVAPWNQLDILERMFTERGERIAGVFMEPVLCNSGCLLPAPGYLEAVRALCNRYGVLLVFDEVITGFRISLAGAQGYYGVTPDLATFGKAVGGGAALSVVAGRQAVLELMFSGGVAYGGTFNGNPLSLAAAEATLETLEETRGLEHANRMGAALRDGINDLAAKRGLALRATGFGAAFALHFSPRAEFTHYRDTLDDDAGQLREFLLRLLQEGVQAVPDGRFYTSAVHTEQDIDKTLAAVSRAL